VARNKVLLIFCLLALATVAVHTKVVLDTYSEMTKAGNPVSDSLIDLLTQTELVDYVRNRMSLLLGVTIICLCSMIGLYVLRIHRPLKRLTRITKEMANRNLSVSVQSRNRDEVGELAEVIVDLAANCQEVLLLTGTVAGNSSSAVERIDRALDLSGKTIDQKALQEQIAVIKKDLAMLGSMVKDFKFYQTRFEGRKVVSTARKEDD